MIMIQPYSLTVQERSAGCPHYGCWTYTQLWEPAREAMTRYSSPNGMYPSKIREHIEITTVSHLALQYMDTNDILSKLLLICTTINYGTS